MSTLTSKLDALYDQKHSLQGQLAEAKAAFAAKKNSAALEISRLSVSADSLAAEFRSLFAAAAAAHASGEGGEAAGLAAAGRTAQAACEAANAKAAELRAGLKTDLGDLRQNISSIRGQLDQLDANIAAVRDENAKRKQDRPKADPTKAIAVKGFHRAKGIDQRMVREVLSDLPPRLLAEIESVTYLDLVADDMALGRTQAKPMVAEKGRIFMFKHPLYELDAESLRQPYREALVHEAGHILFERLMTLMQQLKWGNMFAETLRNGDEYITEYAAISKREDFGECFRFYQLRQATLVKEQPERYTFINEVYKEVSK